MPIHHATPLLRSDALEARLGAPVWLKMESSQPCASFKLRGMGLRSERAVAAGATSLVTSSGGNAGYAVAWAGRELGVPVTVVVPQSTNARMRGLIEAVGADVLIHGEVWDDAHAHATRLADERGAAYCHPFDHPHIWEGHSSMIDEVAGSGVVPGAVVVAVGGGGLMNGVLDGLHRAGWTDTPVIAVETHGAASFAAAVEAGEPVTLDAIDTIALTMGAKRVCDASMAWVGRHDIRPVQVSDRAAADAVRAFLDDHRVLVEPSCGAALSLAYDRAPILEGLGPVLVIVCGGAAVVRADLDRW